MSPGCTRIWSTVNLPAVAAAVCLFYPGIGRAWAGPPTTPVITNGPVESIERLVELVKPSIVVISHYGHDGNVDGVGTGFVVSPDGLVATSLHVIGEARPVVVQFPDGHRLEASEIYAFDRKLDLAVIRIPTNHLAALRLGDSDKLRQGSSVAAIGNPFGLEMSVVEGVVSATREIDGQRMIQLAMPIEPGNSGGPLVDRSGGVQGVLTLKSLVTPNLGFAMPVNDLKTLLAKPNPVPMDRWLSIGALDPAEWKPLMGGRWSQKPGCVLVEGRGRGWGGRALCLSETPPPPTPFEIQVRVKLAEESGAAGLTFGSDGDQRCYGFYPTDGRMRLTRFDGPNVSQWSILREEQTAFYRPGGWNLLKVRIDGGRITCFVNGHRLFESMDPQMAGGRFGLCKFRDTKATFKGFQTGPQLADESNPSSAELSALIDQASGEAQSGSEEKFARDLAPHADEGRVLLLERARNLEVRAARLRRIAIEAHRRSVAAELSRSLQGPAESADLFRDALLVAKLDNPELEVEAYVRQVKRMGRELENSLPKDATAEDKLAALRRYLFAENGFHASLHDDFERSNCYMSDVLDDRAGWPIMLAILYLELAEKLHVDSVAGLALPSRFMVSYRPAHGAERIIDVADGGREIDRKTAEALVAGSEGEPLPESAFRPATKQRIIVRVLNNLYLMAQRGGEAIDGAHYLDAILAIAPDSTVERLNRARLRIQSGDVGGAKADYRWLMEHEAGGVDLEAIGRIYESL